MVCYKVGILLILLQICSAFINFDDPKKYHICFFQQIKVFKCQDSSIKKGIQINYFSPETGEQIDMNTNTQCPIPNSPIKIISHGWMDSSKNAWVIQMREFYKNTGVQNVFAVNWSKYSHNPNYLQSATDVKCIGDVIGDFIINHLVRNCNSDLRDLHLIGHSLGAHIVGFAGKYVQKMINTESGNKVYRITGLDAAGPCFWKCDSQYRLDKEDAEIVDVIHTDKFKYGCAEPMGDFDFYVNGGDAPQPGCIVTRKKRSRSLLETVVSCSHMRATALFTASIGSEGFISKQCNNEFLYKTGQCNANTALIMGEHLNDTLAASGVYQLQTSGKFPFAKFGQISIL